MLCFSIAISVVVTSLLLGGRAGRMFGNEVYEQVITAGNWPFASGALSTVLALQIVLSIGAAMTLSRAGCADAMMARSRLLKAYVYLIFALITAPLLVVIGVSFNPTEQFIITPLTPSLHWYYAFFQRREYVNALFGVTRSGVRRLLASPRSRPDRHVGRDCNGPLRHARPGGDRIGIHDPNTGARHSAGCGVVFVLFGVAHGRDLYAAGDRHTLIGIPFVIRVVSAGLVGINPALEEAAINLAARE